jgi:hypothetical protein
MGSRLEGSLISFAVHPATVADWCDVGRMSIDMLPEVALLDIFDCYVNQARKTGCLEPWLRIHAWHTLVHVCRKWRTIVFGSPRRLGLRLFCKETTPVKEKLAVWPPLPIVIGRRNPLHNWRGMENIIAALEHNDRVCEIDLVLDANSELEELLAATQQPFPELTHLNVCLQTVLGRLQTVLGRDETPVVPESFLGGSAPRLQYLHVQHIPFPRLPKLLLSATGLVELHLVEIIHSGYISPEAMVRCLSTLTRLERLAIKFIYTLSPLVHESRRPHPPTRSILPALTDFRFEGGSEYLEDLVARIDAPFLDTLCMRFFYEVIFDTPQLAQFVARTSNTQPPVEARIIFSSDEVKFISTQILPREIVLGISCAWPDLRLSSLAQVCNSSFPEAFVSKVEHLYMCGDPYSQDDTEDSQWLEVLHPFTAVKYLYLSDGFTSRIAPSLQDLAGEALPSLQNLLLSSLFLPGHVRRAIGKFVARRQLAGHPIAVSHWDAVIGG